MIRVIIEKIPDEENGLVKAETHSYRKMGDVSDGYHTFNELYRHRYVLFVALMRTAYGSLRNSIDPISNAVWISKLHADGTMFEDSFIAGMQLATGQVSYHLPLREWDRVAKLLPLAIRKRAPEWDGHTPEEVLERLEEFVYVAGSERHTWEGSDGRD